MAKINKILKVLLYIFLITFSIFIIYQIILKIIGGSWQTEDIIASLVILIITLLFTIAGFLINQEKTLGKIESSLDNLTKGFCSLAKDFKQHLSLN